MNRTTGDEPFIRRLNIATFKQNTEADIVDELRKSCKEFLSLVAIENERIIGRILFTPAIIEANEKQIFGMELAPIAVLPEDQNKGTGCNLFMPD